MIIFINNKSIKFCQTTMYIKRFIHERKVVPFFCLTVYNLQLGHWRKWLAWRRRERCRSCDHEVVRSTPDSRQPNAAPSAQTFRQDTDLWLDPKPSLQDAEPNFFKSCRKAAAFFSAQLQAAETGVSRHIFCYN